MASMTIRDIDHKLKLRLRVQAAQHGRSMEEEAREILRSALNVDNADRPGLYQSLRQRVERFGGVDLAIEPREPLREPTNLDV